MEGRRHERLGALAIPEGQRRGTLRQDLVPLRRWSFLLDDILNQQFVPFETDCGIAGTRLVPELSDRVARLLSQHVARVFRANAIEWAVAKPERQHRKQTRRNGPEHRPRSETAETCPFAS